MESHFLCGICYEVFDETVHVPQILQCCHTFCRLCISNLGSECAFRCSSDTFRVMGTNYAFLNLVREVRSLPSRLFAEVISYPSLPFSDDTLSRHLTWFIDSLFVFPFVLIPIIVNYCIGSDQKKRKMQKSLR